MNIQKKARGCLLFAILAWLPVASALDFETVQRAKSATALVLTPGDNEDILGSAFCIDSTGFFISNEHVARGAHDGKLVLVVNPGQESEKRLPGKVVRVDADSDLALIQTDEVMAMTLPLGSDEKLFETMELTAFGYPFGKALATNADTLPVISVNVGKVTALRRKKGKLVDIQLDAAVNPGNSGGPVLNEEGAVVGIITKGIPLTGVNFATPVSLLKEFLKTPLLRPQFPEAVSWADRSRAIDLEVVVEIFPGGQKPDLVEIQLGDAANARKFRMKSRDDDVYRIKTVLIPAAAEELIAVEFETASASVSCKAEDKSYSTSGDKVKLSEIRRYNGSDNSFLLADGESVIVKKPEKQEITAIIGGQELELPLASLKHLDVRPESPPTAIDYRLVATADDELLAEVTGEIYFEDLPEGQGADKAVVRSPDRPNRETPGTIKSPSFDGHIERKVPATIDDVIVAGGGRFLLLRLDKLKKLAVFDVNSTKIEQYLPLPNSDTLVTAGASTIVMVVPGQNVIQRWNLKTLERELVKALPVSGIPLQIGMGYGSEGPILLRSATSGPSSRCAFTLLDLETLKQLPGEPSQLRNGQSHSDKVQWRFSADGRALGSWCTTHSPSGLEYVSIRDGKLTSRYEHDSVGYVLPGPDGSVVYTQGAGIFTDELQPVAQSPKDIMLLPTTLATYFLGTDHGNRSRGRSKMSATRLRLYVTNDSRPIATLPETPELRLINDPWGKESFDSDKYVYFIPQADLLVTIGADRNRLLLRKVAVEKLLEEAGTDYFFVQSMPVTTARAGAQYRYQMAVKSKSGKIVCKLESGPPGMRVSANGKVTWSVPREQTDDTSIVILIKDGSGQEIFHAYTIEVR